MSSPDEGEEKFPESGRRNSCAEKSTLKVTVGIKETTSRDNPTGRESRK